MPISGIMRCSMVDAITRFDLFLGFGADILIIGTGSINGLKETHRSRRSDPQSFRCPTPAFTPTSQVVDLFRFGGHSGPTSSILHPCLGCDHQGTSIVKPKRSQGASLKSCLTPR
jgi:hypothetical protein